MPLHVIILGSAAGGGYPQWNCNTALSRLYWTSKNPALARTQSSVAVSSDGRSWVILNASPDIRQQILATSELHPDASGPLRTSPIAAVVLTNGDVDHIAGLLSLRERHVFSLYAAQPVLASLEANSIFNVLDPSVVTREALPLDNDFEVCGLTCRAFAVPGKVPLYAEGKSKSLALASRDGDTIGLCIHAPGSGQLCYIPGCTLIDDALIAEIGQANLLLFDGTVLTDTEMIDAGVGQKTGRRMGHVPILGEGGSLHAFDGAPISRKFYIHINTTNPILDEGSDASRAVREAGWGIAYDGMRLTL